MLTVLLLTGLMLCPSRARAAGEGVKGAPPIPVTAKANVAVRHHANGQTMLLLTGHVELSRGSSRMEADRVLVWIDEVRSDKLGVVVLAVYGEGSVLTVEKGSRATSPRVFFHWTASDFTVDDADGFIARSARDFKGPFIDRAEAVRARGTVPAVQASIPPKARPAVGELPPKTRRRTQVVQPTRIGLIYGQQQEGPHIKSFVEGDYRVTVVTHYPDVVFFDPGSKTGRLEVLAENMVIWVNEKKLREGGPLKDAELEIYAEGKVVIYQARKSVRCEQLYYDYKNQHGLIVGGPGGDAVVKVFSEEKNLPLFYRAKEFRQISSDEYLSKGTIITTSEFGIPDWGVYASEVKLTAGTRTMRDTWGRAVGTEPTEIAEARHARLVFSGIPVFYWPRFTRDLKNDKTALKHLQFGSEDDLGVVVKTVWDLYDLGVPQNDWSEFDLLLDYFSDRGAAGGLSFTYDRPDMVGEILGYYLHDTGEDKDGVPAEKTSRGRFKWLHRQPLTERWRLDTEVSWISDSEFLREYNEAELKEDKEQETLFYLRYLHDNRYFGLLGKWRLNSWQTQNEHMPEARFVWLGQPVFGGTLTYLQDTRVGHLRRRWNDDLQGLGLLGPDYQSWRAYTEHEVQVPFRVGFVKLAPFVNMTYSWYDLVPRGGHDRLTVTTGVRSSATVWRIYNYHNRLLDVNRLRHVVTPTVDVFSTFVRTKPPGHIFQFDEVDALDDTKVVRLGLRQRLQTRRLGRRIEPAGIGGWYTVNWMILDLEMDYFPQAHRHNAGRDVGPLNARYLWQISDRAVLVSEADVRLDRGMNLDTYDVGVILNRSPKMAVYLGYRYINTSSSNMFIGSLNYKLNERWTLGFLGLVDIGAGATSDYRVMLKRRLHRWILEFAYERDGGEDENSFMLLFGPQILPESQLRFF